jgi:hypothetical protein
MPAFGFSSVAGGDDELGVWEALPAATSRDLSLGALDGDLETPPEEISLWKVVLPRDRRAASETLAVAERRLSAAESALPYAAQRLAGFVAAGGPSPGLPSGLAAPEVALYDWVAASGENLGLPAEAGRLNQVIGFFEKVQDSLRNYAAIDTERDGARIGLTLVSWAGDFRTAWPQGLALDEAQQHHEAVALALRTRDAWLRLGLTVARGAVQLTALFSLNPALALPAAYGFVRQVIDQVQALGGLPAPRSQA